MLPEALFLSRNTFCLNGVSSTSSFGPIRIAPSAFSTGSLSSDMVPGGSALFQIELAYDVLLVPAADGALV